MNTIEKCRCCGKDIDITIPRGYAKWTVADSSISLPAPPDDISGAFICDTCYVDGPTLEARIRLADSLKPSTVNPGLMPKDYIWVSGDITSGSGSINVPVISGGDANTGSAKAPEPIPEPKAKPAPKNEIDYWNQPYPKMGQKFR